MSAATEKVVKIAAELYKCRDVLVRVHGVAEYRRQIADPVGHLRAISEARGEDIPPDCVAPRRGSTARYHPRLDFRSSR
jgi:hypothetical protein